MTKDKALKMAIKEMTDAIPHLDIHFDDYFEAINACKEALEQPAQRNFCERCGKRASKDPYHIHTCTPPQAKEWQGLSDDEINNIYDSCQKVIAETNIKRVGDNALDVFLIGISNAIKTGILESEQALKEKNHVS